MIQKEAKRRAAILAFWQKRKSLSELNESRMEIVAGRGKVLRSLKDLR